MKSPANIKLGFFGTPDYATLTLDVLKARGYDIRFVVTSPDKPKGRGLTMTASPAKLWAIKNGVPVIQPVSLRNNPELVKEIKNYGCDIFVVMAYGKIMPEEILNIPAGKSLNIHPSLLPKFRGSCPVESAILADDKNTGVTIMRMDALMDHGPIVATKEVIVEPWPPTAEELGTCLVEAGADLMADILPEWLEGTLPEQEQDHAKATVTKKIVKEDGLIDLGGDGYSNYLKFQAYNEWPQAFFFVDRGGRQIRVKITVATFTDGRFLIEKVIPEGGKEISYADFQRGQSR